MYVIEQEKPADTAIPGVRHATWAGRDDGLEHMSVWRQSLAPGGATPPHYHDAEELVMCISGVGEIHADGKVHRVTAGQTAIVPAGVLHQIFNVGTVPLESLAVVAETPVSVYLPDGEPLPLPWRT